MSVRTTVLKIISDYVDLNLHEIKDDSVLYELDIDAIEHVFIITALEEEFEIDEINDEEAEAADTVGKLVALVERLVAK